MTKRKKPNNDLQETFENTQGMSRGRKRTDSAMAKPKREKRTNNDIQSKDRATKAPMQSGSELRYSERKAVPVPHVAPVVLLLLQTYCRRGYW